MVKLYYIKCSKHPNEILGVSFRIDEARRQKLTNSEYYDNPQIYELEITGEEKNFIQKQTHSANGWNKIELFIQKKKGNSFGGVF